MVTDTVAQMTQVEFKQMLESVVKATVEQKFLEILGDPDEGSEVRKNVRDRLLRQRQVVSSGQYGQPFEDVAQKLGLE